MSRLILWSITSALAGFLFGFDTVVISGAEKTIQGLWELGNFAHGFAMAAALYGTVLGALLGGWPTDRFGRKDTLLWIGLLYLVSAVGSALAPEVVSFIVFRFIGGLGVGVSTVAAPLYISEIAPARYRGRLTGLFQFNIVFGILIAFLSNALLGGIGEQAWRWMLGVEAVPALIYTLMCLGIPESPRWLLVKKASPEEGLAVLRLLDPEADAASLDEKAKRIVHSARQEATASGFFSKRLKIPILLAFLIAFFNQLSGINAILYFAPRIFQMTGLTAQAALLQSVGIGVTNLLFTFVGLWLIDRLGRRTLLVIGSLGYIASLGVCAWAFLQYAAPFKVASSAIAVSEIAERMEDPDTPAALAATLPEKLTEAKRELERASSSPRYAGATATLPTDADLTTIKSVAQAALEQASGLSRAGARLVLICLFLFIAAHAIGQGTVIWVFISEIFPNRFRAAGQALGSFTHWIFAALLTTFFPAMIGAFAPGYVFLFFCTMMVLQLVWVKTMVPETKGVPLEEMQRKLGIDG